MVVWTGELVWIEDQARALLDGGGRGGGGR